MQSLRHAFQAPVAGKLFKGEKMNLFFWQKPKEPSLAIPAIKIIYTYGPDQPIHTFTYESEHGRPLMYYATTRKFIKWYFGRPQSPSIFIVGKYTNQLEWRREHILRIELIRDMNNE